MLSDILKEKGLSVYNVSKNTGIPYSTVFDLVQGNTLIERTNADCLYRLSKYLGISMERLFLANKQGNEVYIYNKGRTVFVKFGGSTMQYMGPKNLVGFKKVNRYGGGMISLDTYFFNSKGEIYIEEDYINLYDVLKDYGQENLVTENEMIHIGKPGTSYKESLINEALFVSDSIVITYEVNTLGSYDILAVNLNRSNRRLKMRLDTGEILFSNMSEAMKKRVINIVQRNRDIVLSEIAREESLHA